MSKRGEPTGIPYVQLRDNVYYCRMRIPADVKEAIGQSEFFASLKTTHRGEATRRSQALVFEWKRIIDKHRGGTSLDNQALEWRAALLRYETYLETHNKEPERITEEMAPLEVIDIQLDRVRKSHGDAVADRMADIAYGGKVPTAAYLDEWQSIREQQQVTEKTRQQERSKVEKLAKKHPNLPIERREVVRWIHELEGKGKAAQTIKKDINIYSQYFRYLQSLEYIDSRLDDPFAGHKFRKKLKGDVEDSRQAYKLEDVTNLIKAAKGAKKPDQQLIDVVEMLAYTGARLQEITQLRVDRVFLDVDIPYMLIGKAKSVAGVREVPIHSKILEKVKRLHTTAKGEYLFNDMGNTKNGRGSRLSTAFSRLRDRLKFGKSHTLHSLRNTVITTLEQSNIGENVTADVVGHKKRTLTYGLYSGGASMAQKKEAIEKVIYPE